MKLKLMVSLIPWGTQVLYVCYGWWFLSYHYSWPGYVGERVFVLFVLATFALVKLNCFSEVSLGTKIEWNKLMALAFVPLHLAGVVSASSLYLPLDPGPPPVRSSSTNISAALSNMYHLRNPDQVPAETKGPPRE